MARQSPIRIMERDKREYARLVRNARAKVRRTQKNYGVDLSGEYSAPDIESFSYRSEFNRKKEELKSFTSRYNLDYQFKQNKFGVVASKKELQQAERGTRAVREDVQRRKKEMDKKPVQRRGEQYSTIKKQRRHFTDPDVTGLYEPEQFDFSKVRSRDRLNQIFYRNEKRLDPNYYDERKETMKQNFIEMLEGSFGNEADEVVSMIKDVPADDFYEMWLKLDEIDFDLYDSEGEHVTATSKDIGYIRSHIEQYYENQIDNELKNF